jgi:hypothetical protein
LDESKAARFLTVRAVFCWAVIVRVGFFAVLSCCVGGWGVVALSTFFFLMRQTALPSVLL